MRTTLPIEAIIDEWYHNTDVMEISKLSYRKKLGYWFRWLTVNEVDVRYPARSNVLVYKTHLGDSHRENTVDSYLKAVKSFYGYCEARGYCENIAAGVRMSRRKHTHSKRALTRDESERLLDSIDTRSEKDLRDKIIVSLMICNGLRSVEIERLKVKDWLTSRIIMIKRKGRRDKQQMLIDDAIYRMIEDYMSCRCRAEPDDPLLINHSRNHLGAIINRQSISKMVKARLRGVGIDSDKVTSHSLRHTCAQLLLTNSVPIEEIQIIFGHTNINTTKIYLGDAQQNKLIQNSPCVALTKELLNRPKQGKE